MLGVEDVVHGGEADVLIGTTVASDVVRVEQLAVIGASRRRAIDRRTVLVAHQTRCGGRIGAVSNVNQELVARADRALVRSTGSARLPSTRKSSAVSAIPSTPFIITIGRPFGPLMKLPY